jgi:hypothetical protein
MSAIADAVRLPQVCKVPDFDKRVIRPTPFPGPCIRILTDGRVIVRHCLHDFLSPPLRKGRGGSVARSTAEGGVRQSATKVKSAVRKESELYEPLTGFQERDLVQPGIFLYSIRGPTI